MCNAIHIQRTNRLQNHQNELFQVYDAKIAVLSDSLIDNCIDAATKYMNVKN